MALLDEAMAYFKQAMSHTTGGYRPTDGTEPLIPVMMANFAAEQLWLQREKIAADLKQIAGEELESYIKQLQEQK